MEVGVQFSTCGYMSTQHHRCSNKTTTFSYSLNHTYYREKTTSTHLLSNTTSMNKYQHSHFRNVGSSHRSEPQNNHHNQVLALNALGQGKRSGPLRWSPPLSYYDMAMAKESRKKGQYQISAPPQRRRVHVEPQNDNTTVLRATPGSMELTTTTTTTMNLTSYQPRTSSSSFLLSQAKKAAAQHDKDNTANKKQTTHGNDFLRWPPLVPFPTSPATIVWGQRITAKNEERNLVGVYDDPNPVEQVHMYHPKSKHHDDNVWVAFDICYY